MSRNAPTALKDHLAENVTTVAICWRIARVDGQEFFLTNHDRDLVIAGDTYKAATGVLPSATTEKSDMSVSNLEAMSVLDADEITEADITAGFFDGASLDIFVVNWAAPEDGVMYLAKDWTLGETTVEGGQFRVECRSKSERLNKSICELYSPDCRATLGDARCQVDIGEFGGFQRVGSVSAVTSRSVFVHDGSAGIEDVFRYGLVRWQTGANSGLSMEIKSFTPATQTFELFAPMPYDIQIGDEHILIFGCDKKFETCRDRFSNVVNFHGEPFVPGLDRALDVVVPGKAVPK